LGGLFCYSKKVDVPCHRFIKHVSSRWLTVRRAAERIFEQWNALNRYFLKDVPLSTPKDMQKRHYKEIVERIKDPSTKAQLLFVMKLEGPLVQCLYDKGQELILKLRSKVYREEVSGASVADSESLIPLKDLHFSEQVSRELQLWNGKNELQFRLGAQKHYIACTKYLGEQLKLDKEGNVLKDI